MSTITPISQPTTTDIGDSPSTSSVTRTALTDDLDTFLTLLTTQLENQDPLEPTDTNQFVDQLTQFSELEQGVEQNETLNEIAAQLRSDDGQADIGLLGRTVEAETETVALGPEGARFAFQITSPTEKAEMRIFNEAGRLVAKFDVEGDAGRYDAGWNGEMLTGGIAPQGLYRAQVVATPEDGDERLAGQILSGGTVREVRFENGSTRLILDQGMTITSDEIRRVGIANAS